MEDRVVSGITRRVADRDPATKAPVSGRETTFRDDDRGQLLILTGVLLVLGFVTIGATLVQVQTLDETTTRQHRDSLLDTFDELLTKFNQTLVDGAFLGETDRAQFKDFASRAEAQMRDGATKRGIYLTVALDEVPDETFFQRQSRCYAYQSKDEGVISSYELNTREETIVGAVYDIYASDGMQSIATQYYVKLQECVDQDTATFVDSIEAHYGTVLRFANATQEGDDPRAMTVKEEYVEGSPTTSYLPVDGTTLADDRWSNEAQIVSDDTDKATQDRSNPENFLRFRFDLSAIPADASVSAVTARVDAWQEGMVDDTLTLTATLDGDTSGPHLVTTLLVESTSTIVVPHPAGADHWTRQQLADTVFELEANAVGAGHDPSGKFHVDYVNLTTIWSLDRHDMQVDFEFDRIPNVFHEHHVNVSYRMPETNTTGEEFYFQAYDGTRSAGTEWRTLATITETGTDWGFIDKQLIDQEYPATGNQRPLFRIIDSDSGDADQVLDADLDYIEFDWVKVRSLYVKS